MRERVRSAFVREGERAPFGRGLSAREGSERAITRVVLG